MKLKFASVMVQDQDKALGFYGKILGFKVKEDLKLGEYRWLTVESTDGIAGVELILEQTDFPPSVDYQRARFEAGIPAIALTTQDIQADFKRLSGLGVTFRGEPTDLGFATCVSFEDGCGNLVNLVQQ